MKPETKLAREHAKRQAKLKELADLERLAFKKRHLPHLYGMKWFAWARKFFESDNKECFLIAANQSSKSSTQIRKVIHWATDKSLWPRLWPGMTPNQFWYLYPNKDVATAEFHTKWKQFLPSVEMKDDSEFGWEAVFERKQIKQIIFKSGVTLYFKTYSQDVQDLQTGTVYAIFGDEEMPVEILGELQARLNATDGYFNAVFTATLGQDYWRRTMEARVGEVENHPNALKQQISLYDCLLYEDGTKSHWTKERIERIKLKCTTHTEELIRVWGKFAKLGGRKYEAYDEAVNRSPNHPLPDSWSIYTGVDIGSGGAFGHPAAICFVAVDPTLRRGRVFKAWRGDGEVTDAATILTKYLEMRGTLAPTLQCYDFASAEFRIIAESAGETFEPAEKKHEVGERIINTLFKHKMLAIQDGDPELDKLSSELMTLSVTTAKRDAADDLVDSLRYALTKIPWDFSGIEGMPVEFIPKQRELTELDLRRGVEAFNKSEENRIEEEFDELNELYDA